MAAFPRSIVTALLGLFGFSLAVVPVSSNAFAVDPPEPDLVVTCDVSGEDVRGTEVCFISSDFTSGGVPQTVGVDYQLFFQDESEAFGEGSAGLTIRLGVDDGSGISPFNAPSAGDVLEATIAYPVIDVEPAGDVEGIRGNDVAAGLFAVVRAEDFEFSQSLETSGAASWVEIDISMTFVTVWGREGCDFGEFDENTGFFAPTAACESENGDVVSSGSVGDNIAFYTPETFPDFVNNTTNGGYLNYQGSGMSWATEPNNFQFQLYGPRYANGSDRNTGALQAFLPQSYMEEIFGLDFDPASPTWDAARKDVTDAGLVTEDLSSSVVTSARNSGLLIELASYQFSAPVFSFAPPSEDSGSTSSNDGKEVGPAGIFLTVPAKVGESLGSQELVFGSFAISSGAPYVLTLRSIADNSLRVLSQGNVSAGGHMEKRLFLPVIAGGNHAIELVSRGPSGETLRLVNIIVVDNSARYLSISPEVLQPYLR